METTYYVSPIGTLAISGSSEGVRSILYADDKVSTGLVPDCLQECVIQLNEYFNGNRTVFNLVLDPVGTEFQKKVWAQLLTINFGETASYIDLANRVGNPKTVRAVGNANGQNKLNIVIPCHRVIGSDKSLIGYGGGIWRKEWLLKHEASMTQIGLFKNQ